MRTLETLLFGPAPVDISAQAQEAGITTPVYVTANAHTVLRDCRCDGIGNLLLVLCQTMRARQKIGLSAVPAAGMHVLVYLPGARMPICGFTARQREGALIVSRVWE